MFVHQRTHERRRVAATVEARTCAANIFEAGFPAGMETGTCKAYTTHRTQSINRNVCKLRKSIYSVIVLYRIFVHMNGTKHTTTNQLEQRQPNQQPPATSTASPEHNVLHRCTFRERVSAAKHTHTTDNRPARKKLHTNDDNDNEL